MDETAFSLEPVNRLIGRTPNAATRPEPIISLLDVFCDANKDPKTSPNFRSSEPDDTKALGLLLGDTRARSNERLILIILRCLKIVSRKVQTRASIPPAVLAAVNAHVKAPKTSRVAREAVSVVLNSCYERQHVDAVVADDVVPALVTYLSADDPELQAAAAGALQSVCFQDRGKACVRELGAVPELVKLLDAPHSKLVARAVGALHNLSSDAQSVLAIREAGGVSPIVTLLRSNNPVSVASAAGAVQNLSREEGCRLLIRQLDGVRALTDLLFVQDTPTVVAAVGALLNILGPDFGAPSDENSERRAFRKLLSLCVTLGATYNGLFGEDTS